jgi:hypothetical protein
MKAFMPADKPFQRQEEIEVFVGRVSINGVIFCKGNLGIEDI